MGIGKPAQQHERRHDQEAAADTNQPRDHANGHPFEPNLPGSMWLVWCIFARAWAEHHDPREHHHHGEQDELHRARDVSG
jgi:hypothetical protein